MLTEDNGLRDAGKPHFTDSLRWTRAFQGIWAGLALLALTALFVVGAMTSQYFLTGANMAIIVRQTAPMLLLVVPTVMIVAAGGVDLSVGSVIALTGVIAARLIDTSSLPAALCAAMLAALSIGLANGLVVSLARVHAAIVTLAMMVLVRGIAFQVSDAQNIYFKSESLNALSSPGTATALVALPLLIGAALVYLTPCCRRSDSHRSWSKRALFTGLPYVLSSLAAGVVGVFYLGRLRVADPNMGVGSEISVLAIVLLGGTVFGGGTGNLVGALLAAFALTLLNSVMVLANWPQSFCSIVPAAILLVFDLLTALSYYLVDFLYRRRLAKP
jgi:ribose transport system permease protein